MGRGIGMSNYTIALYVLLAINTVVLFISPIIGVEITSSVVAVIGLVILLGIEEIKEKLDEVLKGE